MTAIEVAAVIAVVAVAATIQMAAGFGFALAASPGLAVVLEVHDAVIVTLLLATFTNAYQAWTGRTETRRDIALRMLVGAAFGLPVGLAMFAWFDEWLLQGLIGVAVLVAVMLLARGVDLRHTGPSLDIGSGFFSGTMTASTGVNGPPLVFVLQARHLQPDSFRATITAVFFILDVVSVAVFSAAGHVGSTVLAAVVVSIPGQLVGAAVGYRLRSHLDPRRFRAMVLTLLAAAAVTVILSSVAGAI